MEEPTRELQVPASIFERAEAIARDCERSAESVMLDALSLHFCELAEIESEPVMLQALPDEQLWALVHRRRPSADQRRSL